MWKIGEMIEERWEVLDAKEGGMGIVYIVKDYGHSKDFARPVYYAAKTLQDRFLGDASRLRNFEQEAYTWVKLGTYTHIVRAVFAERLQGRPYVFSEAILTERFPNNLRGWISRELISIPISLLFAVQFCKGMEYASLKGLKGHFDIKPENVMITDEGIVKITDWGLARLATGVVETPQGVLSSSPHRFVIPIGEPSRGGTLPYMAPELFTDDEVTPKVDMYSFGVMLYEMVTGRLPFTERNYPVLREAHLHTIPPSLHTIDPAVPKTLSDIVMACLEKNPNNRPRDFVTMKEELAIILKEQTGKDFPLDVKVWELEGADARMAAYALHFLGRDDEAMALMARGMPEEKGPAVMMWDDKELGFSVSIPPELWEQEQAKLQENPQNPDLWASVANLYALIKEYDKTIEHYEQAIHLAPDRAEEWQERIESIKRSIVKEKAKSLITQGDNLAKAGKHREAWAILDEAIRLDPDNAVAWYNAGVCRMAMGDSAAAVNCFDRATRLDPDLVQAWSNRGALLAQLGKIEEALQSLERACQLDPKHVKAWLNKGGILMSLGFLHDALQCFDKALEIDPHYAKAHQARQMCLKMMKQ
jgi:serine/threonine protein kinase